MFPTRIARISKWRVNPFCQLPERVIAKLHDKVDVRRHQTVRHEPGIMGLKGLAQKLQILFPRAVYIQIKSSIMKSRNDMKQSASDMKFRKSRHATYLDKGGPTVKKCTFQVRPPFRTGGNLLDIFGISELDPWVPACAGTTKIGDTCISRHPRMRE
jgi:hypothetical protein